jgi:ribosomal protein S18 acetylase RimI-like enzyme
MEITIRRATLDDLSILVGFVQAYYAHDKIPFSETASRAALTDLLAHEHLGRVWLVYADDQPIGYAVLTFGYSLEFHGREAVLDELYLEAGYRGQGIGTQTMHHLESAAKTLGIGAIHLEVERDNEGAQRFYESLGFQARRRFFLMSKRLGRA